MYLLLEHPACEILNRCVNNEVNNPSLMVVLSQLTIRLHLEKLIKTTMLPPSGQAQVLLSEIEEAVCDDYCKLMKFAEMLCSMTDTAEVGNNVIKEYSK